MGWRFRHSFKVIPGVRLNLSGHGLSASIGGAPFTLNLGPRGAYGTASIPGTGISYRERLVGAQSSSPHAQGSAIPSHLMPTGSPSSPSLPLIPRPLPVPFVASRPVEEVRSASTELLTSASLKELKQVIQTTYEEHTDITRSLEAAREEKERASGRCLSWEHGFLFKRVFKTKFAQIKTESETASAKVDELEEQLRLTTIATHVEIEREQAEPYFRMRDDFAGLAQCTAIWDIKLHQPTDQFHERTTATLRVDRQRVGFSLGGNDLIQWDQKVPHLQNAKGGDLFLYPGFILYRAAREAFSVIDFHDVRITTASVNFQEVEGVPGDSRTVGQTWVKANKDGSPDRRFANNYQIPIIAYGLLSLKSDSGLWEEFHFSNPDRLDQFVRAWKAFVSSFGSQTKTNLTAHL
jgi:hypothetical protein